MRYSLYTDGACEPNPGEGGWAFVLRDDDENEIIGSGYVKQATNNQMELLSVIEGLRKFLQIRSDTDDTDDKITLYSDSKYVVFGISKWMHSWKNKSWIKADGNPVLNKDYWEQMYEINKQVNLECKHVKGHSGVELNELCDSLAVGAIKKKGQSHDLVS